MFLAQLFLFTTIAMSTPRLTDEAKQMAAAIVYKEDGHTPYGRLRMALFAVEKDIGDDALFALAGTHPNVTEMVKRPIYRKALEYLLILSPEDRHDIVKSNTVFRPAKKMTKEELRGAKELAKAMNLQAKKFTGVRLGAFDNRSITIEVHGTTGCLRKKKMQENLILAWPNTPVNNETSRNYLTKVFGARPRPPSSGPSTPFDIQGPSFEKKGVLKNEWGIKIGSNPPKGTAGLDTKEFVDGKQSLRFYTTAKTKSHPQVIQYQEVKPGAIYEVIYYAKGSGLKTDLNQDPSSLGLTLQFFDNDSLPLGNTITISPRLGNYNWEQLHKEIRAPVGAATVLMQFASPISGVVWFDALTITVKE